MNNQNLVIYEFDELYKIFFEIKKDINLNFEKCNKEQLSELNSKLSCLILTRKAIPGINNQIIFDAGTGFKNIKFSKSRASFLLLSHFHHDHIQGLPFNPELFDPKNEIIIFYFFNRLKLPLPFFGLITRGLYFLVNKSFANLFFFDFVAIFITYNKIVVTKNF